MTHKDIDQANVATGSAERINAPRTMKPRNGRQRQIDELYDLYDLVMIERLLERHPSLKKLSGV
jgi:hypothetical protein